jgi:hypothetical protein
MHGKAVALFDFERENENELPLVEGQVIWVSYRHGQGWLVAQDPRTQESGLVPEEYVRLLRDIQGGLNSLTGQANDQLLSPVGDSGTPTQAKHSHAFDHTPTPSNGSNGYQQPIVSTFSTSSKDLHPYPQHLLGNQAGQAPPQVIHYHGQGGSQANTPTMTSSQEGSCDRTSSEDAKARKSEGCPPIAGTLPDAKMAPSIAVRHPDSPVSPESDSTEDSLDEDKRVKISWAREVIAFGISACRFSGYSASSSAFSIPHASFWHYSGQVDDIRFFVYNTVLCHFLGREGFMSVGNAGVYKIITNFMIVEAMYEEVRLAEEEIGWLGWCY